MKILDLLFKIHKENGHIIVRLLGLKLKFRWFGINPIEDLCNINDLPMFREQNTIFPHPLGIVINPGVKIGKNCTIYQNVTIGAGKYCEKTDSYVPTIGNNVVIYANAVVVNGITIGDNVTIGAGAVVLNDVESNCVVAGNPAKVIKRKDV